MSLKREILPIWSSNLTELWLLKVTAFTLNDWQFQPFPLLGEDIYSNHNVVNTYYVLLKYSFFSHRIVKHTEGLNKYLLLTGVLANSEPLRLFVSSSSWWVRSSTSLKLCCWDISEKYKTIIITDKYIWNAKKLCVKSSKWVKERVPSSWRLRGKYFFHVCLY